MLEMVSFGEGIMAIDYSKAEQDFLEELKAGKFSIEVLENKGPDRKKKEAADLDAFKAYMDSEDFQSFNKEALENEKIHT